MTMFNNSNNLFTMNDFFVYLSYGCTFVAGFIVAKALNRRPVNKDKERMDWLESVKPEIFEPLDTIREGWCLIKLGRQSLETHASTLREAIDKVKEA